MIKINCPLVDKASSDDPLRSKLRELVAETPSSSLFLVNNRKFLLTKVYSALQEVLGGKDRVIRDVNKTPAGSFTNPGCKNFLEPNHVVILLTKNHNKKQSRILIELEKAKIPLTLINLGVKYCSPTAKVVCHIPNVRTLYHFLYNFCSLEKEIVFPEFFQKFSIVNK